MRYEQPYYGYREYSGWNQKKEIPVKEKKVRPFEVSTWKKRTLVRDGFGSDTLRVVEVIMVSIDYSRFNKSTNSWVEQCIRFDLEELDDLINALIRHSMKL